ncbi:hypothetical protein AvCA_12160 [Azotobacter vinelandii CA]|uniref:Uncharacterized protein n=2 Tax=Azotobacter vinelandii TaxID=354 RepID=C1DPZ1_AZOVD|nr:hypothetical protein Avin_12160 [Azotobacter vinelandii DJ]AGK15374.1 hypothetical protein AvCA_12160 [Azotobacter vinelandii CA]AGK19796.1 hypothetical protein AvCA6_12160 [Azotobacter vinelandii CA6]
MCQGLYDPVADRRTGTVGVFRHVPVKGMA